MCSGHSVVTRTQVQREVGAKNNGRESIEYIE
jgi:hypothetical protein